MENIPKFDFETPKSPKLSCDYKRVLREFTVPFDSPKKDDSDEDSSTNKSTIPIDSRDLNEMLFDLMNRPLRSPIRFDISSEEDDTPVKSISSLNDKFGTLDVNKNAFSSYPTTRIEEKSTTRPKYDGFQGIVNSRERNSLQETNPAEDRLPSKQICLTNQSTQTDLEYPQSHSLPAAPVVSQDIVKENNKIFLVNKKPYSVVNLLGQGGSSKVYQVYESGKTKLMALKVVNLSGADPNSEAGYRNEIALLEKMKGSSRVVTLYDYEFRDDEKLLLVLMEKGDNDLANVLKNASIVGSLDPIDVKFYWSELLKAVAEIHKAGIIHQDLKPANFIQVMGRLKLIDFGIASALQADMTSVIKVNMVGTLNYMPPESLSRMDPSAMPSKIRTKSDVWSLGCILHQMVFGHHPFQHIVHIISKIEAITNNNHLIKFPDLDNKDLLDVLKICLVRDPLKRPSIDELLAHPYLTSTAAWKTNDDKVTYLIDQIEMLSPKSKAKIAHLFQS